MDQPLTDRERFRLLNDAGRRMLQRLLEHPHAPRYNYRPGEPLTADGLASIRAYNERLHTERTGWRWGELPPWVPPFVAFCRRDVPFHRDRADWAGDFFALPP